MKRRFILVGFICTTLTNFAHAADKYSIEVDATRFGNRVTVSTRVLTESTPETAKQVVASPRILLIEGQRGQVAIGSAVLVSKDKDTGHAAGVESGVIVDVISVKDKDQVVVVTQVVEHGNTIWAAAETVVVKVQKEDAAKP